MPHTREDAIREVRRRLGKIVYVDYMGAGLYPPSWVAEAFDEFSNFDTPFFANPHSTHTLGRAVGGVVHDCRHIVLDYFNALKEFGVVFTHNATASLHTVGDCFPWGERALFICTSECHNSLLGLRTFCKQNTVMIPSAEFTASRVADVIAERCRGVSGDDGVGPVLVAYPLACNFSGHHLSLDLAREIKERAAAAGCTDVAVLVDAAAAAGKMEMQLDASGADFAVFSFYKFLGFPTGVGALLVRKSSAARYLCAKKYFAGGTVRLVTMGDSSGVCDAEAATHDLVGLPDSFEEGTMNFQSLFFIRSMMLKYREAFGPGGTVVGERSTALASQLRERLQTLLGARFVPYGCTKESTAPYGCSDVAMSTNVVAFNLLQCADDTTSWIGYDTIEQLATSYGLQFRIGCFCNPGACHSYVGVTDVLAIRLAESGSSCRDGFDAISGQATGAVRMSFGAYNTEDDVEHIVRFMKECFVDTKAAHVMSGPGAAAAANTMTIKELIVYPVKACAGVHVTQCVVSPKGLEYDREWSIVGVPEKTALTPRMCPELRDVQVSLVRNSRHRCLVLHSWRCASDLHIALSPDGRGACGCAHVRGYGATYSNDVSRWLETALCRRGGSVQFVRTSATSSAARKSAILVISESSFRDLVFNVPSESSEKRHISLDNFRANIVVTGGVAWDETKWSRVLFGSTELVVVEQCARCPRINAVKNDDSPEPLRTLVKMQYHQGKARFGVLCDVASCRSLIPSPFKSSILDKGCVVNGNKKYYSLVAAALSACVISVARRCRLLDYNTISSIPSVFLGGALFAFSCVFQSSQFLRSYKNRVHNGDDVESGFISIYVGMEAKAQY
eukprot:PhM_4_TR2058/c0_g1_i1/m.43215/K15631/ABA3; molybdenum cofactor sulfurtransferase